MEGYVTALWTVVTLVVICTVQCHGNMVSVINRVDDLNREVAKIKKDMAVIGEDIIHQIDLAKISLRSELKQHISELVRESLAGILEGESIDAMVRSQVITEVKQLKQKNRQIERQLNNVSMSFRDIRKEMKTGEEALEKAETEASDLKMCSKYVVDSEMLKRDLKQCEVRNEKCKAIDDTTQGVTSSSKSTTSTSVTSSLSTTPNTSTAKAQKVTSPPQPTSTSTPLATSLTTTPEPEEERSRVLIVPLWSYKKHQFRDLGVDGLRHTDYPLRGLNYIDSVVYVSKLKKLLIGLYGPHKIVSSDLDSNEVVTVREKVGTQGMAVDEGRGIVFVATYSPQSTISSMTPEGRHFTSIIDLSDYGSAPRGITVDTKEKKIYFCNAEKLLMVTYDGRDLQTLATGTTIYALTLDDTGSILYYNDVINLMKLTLSQNVTELVADLSQSPWNMEYYKDRIFYSSQGGYKVGVVIFGRDIWSYQLPRISMRFATSYALCLVP